MARRRANQSTAAAKRPEFSTAEPASGRIILSPGASTVGRPALHAAVFGCLRRRFSHGQQEPGLDFLQVRRTTPDGLHRLYRSAETGQNLTLGQAIYSAAAVLQLDYKYRLQQLNRAFVAGMSLLG